MEPFRFKRFIINHSRSSMPVGLDAILLGTWVKPLKKGHILDVGTGCGIISLICAQRMPDALIKAIDIDKESVEEARINFNISPWAKRLEVEELDFKNPDSRLKDQKWNLIISNPPFFNSGVKEILTPRQKARHEAELSPLSLMKYAQKSLTSDGSLAMIIPAERKQEILKHSMEIGLESRRLCNIIPRPDKRCKRIMIELCLKNSGISPRNEEENLIIETIDGFPTHEFREQTKDFYLIF